MSPKLPNWGGGPWGGGLYLVHHRQLWCFPGRFLAEDWAVCYLSSRQRNTLIAWDRVTCDHLGIDHQPITWQKIPKCFMNTSDSVSGRKRVMCAAHHREVNAVSWKGGSLL